MQIVWKGQACFQITTTQQKEQVKIVIDPYDDSLGLKLPSMEADIALVTHNHFDHNNTKGLKGPSTGSTGSRQAGSGRGNPFVIAGPGEYEVKGVFVQGIASFHDEAQGKERGENTMYTIRAEGVTLCHLGDFGQKELTPEQIEKIGTVDVLLVPVGGTYTINGKEANKVVSQIEPKIIVPMHYALPKLKVKLAPVEEFLRSMGAKKAEPQQKLTLKEKDVAGEKEEAEIVVLQP